MSGLQKIEVTVEATLACCQVPGHLVLAHLFTVVFTTSASSLSETIWVDVTWTRGSVADDCENCRPYVQKTYARNAESLDPCVPNMPSLSQNLASFLGEYLHHAHTASRI